MLLEAREPPGPSPDARLGGGHEELVDEGLHLRGRVLGEAQYGERLGPERRDLRIGRHLG